MPYDRRTDDPIDLTWVPWPQPRFVDDSGPVESLFEQARRYGASDRRVAWAMLALGAAVVAELDRERMMESDELDLAIGAGRAWCLGAGSIAMFQAYKSIARRASVNQGKQGPGRRENEAFYAISAILDVVARCANGSSPTPYEMWRAAFWSCEFLDREDGDAGEAMAHGILVTAFGEEMAEVRSNPRPGVGPLEPSLDGLAAEARKAGSWARFNRDFGVESKRGLYWHLTERRDFRIDPRRGPRDDSSMGDGSVFAGKLMVTSDLPLWDEHYNRNEQIGVTRPYAALIDMSGVPRDAYTQSRRGFGNELWVEDPRRARVVAVMPVDEALRYDARYDAMLPQSEEELRLFYLRAGEEGAPRRRPNPSYPLPASFGRHEPGMMTRAEFLHARNPQEKYHPGDAYDSDLDGLNDDLLYVGNDRGRGFGMDHQVYRGRGGHVLRKDGKTVGVVLDSVLYYPHGIRERELPRHFALRDGEEEFAVTSSVRVKYLDEYVARVRQTARVNAERYPHVLSRIVVKGEPLVVRAEREPETDAGVGLAVFNAAGQRVADASDEWGATLLRVASEYRGKGLGTLIGSVWYEHNPSYESGGFTASGEGNAVRIWEARVSEFMARGWYTALVAAGRLSAERVRQITAGLRDGRRVALPLPAPATRAKAQQAAVRLLLNDFGFVIYDAAFLTDRDERHILGRGFFRSSEHVGQFLFAIDYEPAYRKLATYVALQMARDGGEPVYVGPGYGDLLEIEGLEHVERDGDYARLTTDVLPLKDFARLERHYRKPADPYGEVEQSLWEMSESKWS